MYVHGNTIAGHHFYSVEIQHLKRQKTNGKTNIECKLVNRIGHVQKRQMHTRITPKIFKLKFIQFFFFSSKFHTWNVILRKFRCMFMSAFFDDVTTDGIVGDQTGRAPLSISDQLSATPIGLITAFIVFEEQIAFVLNVNHRFII